MSLSIYAIKFERMQILEQGKACACFWGVMPLRLSKDVSDELYELLKEGENNGASFYEPYYEAVVNYQKKVEQILDCPNISRKKWMGTLKEEHQEPFEDYYNEENQYLMEFSCPITFEVFLPVLDRSYDFAVRYNDKVSTKFRVIYNGIVFLAYCKIHQDETEIEFLGPEIREYLAKKLSCQWWKAVVIPPCPLRETFYVLSHSEWNKRDWEEYYAGKILEDIYYTEDNEIEDIMYHLFCLNSFLVSYFGSLMSRKDALEKTTHTIQELHSEVSEEYCKLSSDTLWRGNKKVAKQIFQLLEELYHYDKQFYDYEKQKKSFREFAECEPHSKELALYCISEYDYVPFPQDSIKNSLAHISNELSYRKTNAYVLVATLIGAAAAFLGSLLSTFFG